MVDCHDTTNTLSSGELIKLRESRRLVLQAHEFQSLGVLGRSCNLACSHSEALALVNIASMGISSDRHTTYFGKARNLLVSVREEVLLRVINRHAAVDSRRQGIVRHYRNTLVGSILVLVLQILESVIATSRMTLECFEIVESVQDSVLARRACT